MRLAFFGTPIGAVPSLQALVAAGHDVSLVVARPDRPLGRSATPVAPPVKAAALALGLSVVQPSGVRADAFLADLAAARPAVIVVVAFGRILPKAVLEAASLGAVNVHFSLLPAYRGAAPVQWALARGESRTGVTTMSINERLDEGDVLLRASLGVEAGEHAPHLMERLAREGAALLLRTLEGLSAGTLDGTPQDHASASYAPILRREDGEWSPEWSARETEGRVRGFDPWPGVWARCRGRRLRIVDAAVAAATTEALPGTVLRQRGEGLPVACAGGGILEVRIVQPEGRRSISAGEAVNGRLLAAGDRLEPPAAERPREKDGSDA